MFFKKKVKLKRGAVLYCGEHPKKIPMTLKQEIVNPFTISPSIWMEGKEIWECPKCKRRIYTDYRINITKTYL